MQYMTALFILSDCWQIKLFP